jgi:O-antigen/teichoic acid export membrane protein
MLGSTRLSVAALGDDWQRLPTVMGNNLRKRERRTYLRPPSSGVWRAGGIPLNTILSTGRMVIRAGVAFALLPLLIDRIGEAPTGLFIVATTLTGYFNSVEYAFGIGVTKYVAEHRATGDVEQLGSVLRASLALMVLIGLAVAALLALLAVLAGPALFGGADSAEAVPTLLVAAVTALFYWPSRLGTAALEGLERYDVNAIVQSASGVLTLASIYIATEWTHSVALLTALFCAMLILEGVCAGVLAWPHLGLRRGVGRWRGAHLRTAMGFTAGLSVMGLADTAIYETDRIMVTAFVGAAAVVVYEAALRPHNGVRQINTLIAAAVISTCARLVAQGRSERLRKLVLVGSLYGIILTTPFAVLTILLARPILEAWVGHPYGHYAPYVQIFVSYWLIHSCGCMMSPANVGIGRIRLFAWLTAIGAVITFGLSIGLAATWGTIGVILGTVIPNWLGFPIGMHYSLRNIGISKASFAREVLIPGYIPVAIWTIPVALCDLTLHPSGLLGIGAFCAVAPILLWLALLPMLRASWRGIGSFEDIVAPI